MKQTILIIFGGMSPEYYVSCKSAANILDNIDRNLFDTIIVGITTDGRWLCTEATAEEIAEGELWIKSSSNKKAMLDPDNKSGSLLVFDSDNNIEKIHIDCVFPIIHGNTGEDGKIQGLLEMTRIPYIGAGVETSAIGINKARSYIIANEIGIKTPRHFVFTKKEEQVLGNKAEEYLENKILELGYPVFVKPLSAGSSIGVSKVKKIEDLPDLIRIAFAYGDTILFEENIEGSEIKVGLLGDNINPQIGEICKISHEEEFNDYLMKCVTGNSKKTIPADISKETENQIKNEAIKYWRALGCYGFARIDFFLTKDNEIIFNEINTSPGLSTPSIFPAMFEASGICCKELITRLIELALKR